MSNAYRSMGEWRKQGVADWLSRRSYLSCISVSGFCRKIVFRLLYIEGINLYSYFSLWLEHELMLVLPLPSFRGLSFSLESTDWFDLLSQMELSWTLALFSLVDDWRTGCFCSRLFLKLKLICAQLSSRFWSRLEAGPKFLRMNSCIIILFVCINDPLNPPNAFN